MMQTINFVNEDVITALNGRLTVGDNVSGLITTFSVTPLAGYVGGDFTPITFQYSAFQRPSVCLLGSVKDTSGDVILNATSLQWSYSNSTSPAVISINYISGLTFGKSYTCTVITL